MRRIVSISALTAGLTPAQIDAEVRSRLAAGEDLYRLDADALGELNPDLILTQDLCAVCAVDVGNVDAALVHLGCRAEVLTVDPGTLREVLASILTVGQRTAHAAAAHRLVAGFETRLERVWAVDADAAFVRPGPRLVDGVEALAAIIHPDAVAARPDLATRI